MVSYSAKLDSRTKQHTQFGVSASNGSRDMARIKVAEKKRKKNEHRQSYKAPPTGIANYQEQGGTVQCPRQTIKQIRGQSQSPQKRIFAVCKPVCCMSDKERWLEQFLQSWKPPISSISVCLWAATSREEVWSHRMSWKENRVIKWCDTKDWSANHGWCGTCSLS